MTRDEIKNKVIITLDTTEMPDGTWCTSLTMHGFENQTVAELAADHMQKLFCGEEIKLHS
jgi:hypothetical protein